VEDQSYILPYISIRNQCFHFQATNTMRTRAFVFVLSLLFLRCLVECYGEQDFSPFNFIVDALSKTWLHGESRFASFDSDISAWYSSMYIGSQDGLKKGDKIQSLPGQPEGVDFDQYSGYITVDPKAGRALFYYFAESPQNSSSKPLVLWLTGDANIIFLESPAGVGFSYSNTTSDYEVSGDNRTAQDSYTFLVNWLERFPEYKNREFYLAGESYAGHYVPQLAQTIIHNNNNNPRTKINLRGIAIANPYIDYETKQTGLVDYLWTHALISDEIHDALVTNCKFTTPNDVSDVCAEALHQATNAFIFDPCSADYVHSYLNIPEVQKALHVTDIPHQWEDCSAEIKQLWKDEALTVLPILQELINLGLRVWILSGDTDPAIPVTATRYAIKKLQTPIRTSWYPWYTQGEVGGFAVGYENLTFVTVRGSGHLVPSYQPARAAAKYLHQFIKSRRSSNYPSPRTEAWEELHKSSPSPTSDYIYDLKFNKLNQLHKLAAANVIFLESPAGVGFSYSNTSSDYTTGDKKTAEDNYIFLIGNAWIDDNTGVKGRFDFYWTHALSSDETYAAINKNCDFVAGNFSDLCIKCLQQAYDESGDINVNNIYAPLCHSIEQKSVKTGSVSDAVLGRLRAWTDFSQTVLLTIKQLMASGIRIWIYSGDVYYVVPVTSSRYAINTFDLTVKEPWRPWYTSKEVGGYVFGYDGLAFVTARGGSSTHPASTLYVFSNKMKTKHLNLLLLLLVTSNLLAFPVSCNGNQAKYLHQLITSRRSSNYPPHTEAWDELHKSSPSPVYIGKQDGLMEADKIDSLPGQPDGGVDFDQYAGYVTVDPKNGRALFYYFVESPQDSSFKPLGQGALHLDTGPWKNWDLSGSIVMGKHSTETTANVIFLESPAGVGFSYSNTSSDYKTGDKKTADDSYTFLVNWLERFPQYKTRDFYITGESYAGHYVPQLAYTILSHNANGNQTTINLKGIAIGNAWIDDNTGVKGRFDYSWTHALNSDETHATITKYCDFLTGNFSDLCFKYLSQAYDEAGNIDWDNIYAPICLSDEQKSVETASVKEFDPCSDDYVKAYLNLAEVQAALHTITTKWVSCGGHLRAWRDTPETILPTIKQLMASGIRIWVYSGDVDLVVPVTSSRYAINTFNLTVKEPWRPWYTSKEVGGYVVGYNGLAFVTVRGAGHIVPSYQPERALTMIQSFLQGTLPPSS
ncbi:hypothetical protein Tsubulata_014820, partial [Turnera subulata]